MIKAFSTATAGSLLWKVWARSSSTLDSTMKNYFTLRMDMSNAEVVNLFKEVQKNYVPRKFFNDHRWQHLSMKV